MVGDVLERLAQHPQAVGLADHHGMERYAADERLALRLAQHLLELVDDHLGELARRVVAIEELRRNR